MLARVAISACKSCYKCLQEVLQGGCRSCYKVLARVAISACKRCYKVLARVYKVLARVAIRCLQELSWHFLMLSMARTFTEIVSFAEHGARIHRDTFLCWAWCAHSPRHFLMLSMVRAFTEIGCARQPPTLYGCVSLIAVQLIIAGWKTLWPPNCERNANVSLYPTNCKHFTLSSKL